MEHKTGTILRFDGDHSGAVSDDSNPGYEHSFEHRGAKVTFVEGEKISYLLITTNNNKKAVNLGKPI